VFPGFKRAKRYKYFSFEIDAFRKLNEVVLRLKHWSFELCESAEKYSVNLMLKKKVLISLQAAIKELLSVSVEKIELCCSAVQDMIKGHCATASRLLKR